MNEAIKNGDLEEFKKAYKKENKISYVAMFNIYDDCYGWEGGDEYDEEIRLCCRYNRTDILKFLMDEDIEHLDWEKDILECKKYNSKETLMYLKKLNPYDKAIGSCIDKLNIW